MNTFLIVFMAWIALGSLISGIVIVKNENRYSTGVVFITGLYKFSMLILSIVLLVLLASR